LPRCPAAARSYEILHYLLPSFLIFGCKGTKKNKEWKKEKAPYLVFYSVYPPQKQQQQNKTNVIF
jgi:hypothetical protein